MNYTGIVVKNSIDFVSAVFEAYVRGQVVVPLKSADHKNRLLQFSITDVCDPPNSTGWASLPFSANYSLDVAQVAFTSGTEGEPKGICISHANLADMVDRLNSVMHMDNTIKEYVGVPVYHSFGFGRCRAIATVGGAFFIPAKGFDPLEIQRMLFAGEINAISAVPSLWRILFQSEDLFGAETHNLKWIEIGSQYMSADEKRRLKQLFPKAVIVQHYGLTEASRATFLEIHKYDDPDILESVGQAVGDTQVAITHHGRIKITGSVVAKSQCTGGDLAPLTDAEGWLQTSDLGSIRNGYLYYGGRADDVINCGGVKLMPEQLERAIKQRLELPAGVACARIADPLRGDGVLVAYDETLTLTARQVNQVSQEVLQGFNVNAGQSLKVLALNQLPVTATGKIKRKELARCWQDESSSAIAAASCDGQDTETLSDKERELIDIWKRVLNLTKVGVNESFLDLGGDSLTSIAVIVKMKRLGISDSVCRGIVQGKTIRQIVIEAESLDKGAEVATAAKNYRHNSTLRDSTNIKIVRGILVLSVIFAHWSEALFNRLPESMLFIKPVFAPLLAVGTPGFAIMYGIVLGYSFIPLYQRSSERLTRLVLPIALALAGGIAVLALLAVSVRYLEMGSVSLTDVTNSFYSVLAYYLLATLSLAIWLKIISKAASPVVGLVVVGAMLHLIYWVILMPLTKVPAQGLVELAKLLVAAKYSYFNLTAGVFWGAAIGLLLINKQAKISEIASTTHLLIGFFGAVLLSIASGQGDQWFVWPTEVIAAWRWIFYLCVCLAMLRLTDRYLRRWVSKLWVVDFTIEVVACVGILAFPLFVLHALVLPSKELLELLGVNSGVAMAGVMGIFLVATALMTKKVYSLQFGGSGDSRFLWAKIRRVAAVRA